MKIFFCSKTENERLIYFIKTRLVPVLNAFQSTVSLYLGQFILIKSLTLNAHAWNSKFSNSKVKKNDKKSFKCVYKDTISQNKQKKMTNNANSKSGILKKNIDKKKKKKTHKIKSVK